MSKPTGKLLFAYQTIASLEVERDQLRTANQRLEREVARLTAGRSTLAGLELALSIADTVCSDSVSVGQLEALIAEAQAATEPAHGGGVALQLREAFPLFDETGLSETEQHCEWSILQERKRLHAVLDALSVSGEGVRL